MNLMRRGPSPYCWIKISEFTFSGKRRHFCGSPQSGGWRDGGFRDNWRYPYTRGTMPKHGAKIPSSLPPSGHKWREGTLSGSTFVLPLRILDLSKDAGGHPVTYKSPKSLSGRESKKICAHVSIAVTLRLYRLRLRTSVLLYRENKVCKRRAGSILARKWPFDLCTVDPDTCV